MEIKLENFKIIYEMRMDKVLTSDLINDSVAVEDSRQSGEKNVLRMAQSNGNCFAVFMNSDLACMLVVDGCMCGGGGKALGSNWKWHMLLRMIPQVEPKVRQFILK